MTTQEHIKARAYQIWESQGRPLGRDLDHWTQAETEMLGDPAPATDAITAAEVAAAEPVADPKCSVPRPRMAKAP